MSFYWQSPDGETFEISNDFFARAYQGELGEEAESWADEVEPELEAEGYDWTEDDGEGELATPLEQEPADVETYEDEPGLDPREQLNEELDQSRPHFELELQRLEKFLGRKVTDAEGFAIVDDTLAAGGAVPDLVERYGSQLKGRGVRGSEEDDTLAAEEIEDAEWHGKSDEQKEAEASSRVGRVADHSPNPDFSKMSDEEKSDWMAQDIELTQEAQAEQEAAAEGAAT